MNTHMVVATWRDGERKPGPVTVTVHRDSQNYGFTSIRDARLWIRRHFGVAVGFMSELRCADGYNLDALPE